MKSSFLSPLLKLIGNFKSSVKARLCHAPCVFVLIGFIRAHHRACLINILLVKFLLIIIIFLKNKGVIMVKKYYFE